MVEIMRIPLSILTTTILAMIADGHFSEYLFLGRIGSICDAFC